MPPLLGHHKLGCHYVLLCRVVHLLGLIILRFVIGNNTKGSDLACPTHSTALAGHWLSKSSEELEVSAMGVGCTRSRDGFQDMGKHEDIHDGMRSGRRRSFSPRKSAQGVIV